jgi:hypothetical protein
MPRLPVRTGGVEACRRALACWLQAPAHDPAHRCERTANSVPRLPIIAPSQWPRTACMAPRMRRVAMAAGGPAQQQQQQAAGTDPLDIAAAVSRPYTFVSSSGACPVGPPGREAPGAPVAPYAMHGQSFSLRAPSGPFASLTGGAWARQAAMAVQEAAWAVEAAVWDIVTAVRASLAAFLEALAQHVPWLRQAQQQSVREAASAAAHAGAPRQQAGRAGGRAAAMAMATATAAPCAAAQLTADDADADSQQQLHPHPSPSPSRTLQQRLGAAASGAGGRAQVLAAAVGQCVPGLQPAVQSVHPLVRAAVGVGLVAAVAANAWWRRWAHTVVGWGMLLPFPYPFHFHFPHPPPSQTRSSRPPPLRACTPLLELQAGCGNSCLTGHGLKFGPAYDRTWSLGFRSNRKTRFLYFVSGGCW